MSAYEAADERKDFKEMQPQDAAPDAPPVDVTNVFTGTGLNDASPGGAYNLNDVNSYTVVVDGVDVSASIGAPQFTGSGLNDATKGGNYTAPDDHLYTIIIDSTGTPDTFKWKKDSGSFTTGVAVTGGLQALIDGVTFRLAATTGHTLNDQWTVAGNGVTDTFKWKKNSGGFTTAVRLTNNTPVTITDAVTVTFNARRGHTLTDQWVITERPRARFYMDGANWMNLVLKDGTVVTPIKPNALAASQATPADPTGTTDATGKMMGLAGALTPLVTGRVLLIISGTIKDGNIGSSWAVQIRYGTGTAPSNGDALTGTPTGNLLQSNTLQEVPFSLNAIVPSLTPGTAIWIDVSLAAAAGVGTATIKNVSISAVELP